MELQYFQLVIIIPLAAAPLIYLTGRVGWRLGAPLMEKLAGWLAVLAITTSALFLALAIQQYYRSGPATIMVQSIALRFDGLSMLLAVAALGLGGLVALYSIAYMAGETGAEKYFAMLATMIGLMVGLGCAGDLFNLWVWFEAMAVSSYLLVVFYRSQPASLEAGVKYVVQSSAGSVLVLLAVALVLMQTGSVSFEEISQVATKTPVLLAAGALFVVGFGVKAALVPLHTWLPDAHTQAPSGISAMLSGVVIEVGLIAILRTLGPLSGSAGNGYPPATWGWILIAAGAVNMLVGNLMALRQKQVKRLLAFSSVSQMGYILFGTGVALYAGQVGGVQGGMFHLLNHGIMKGLAFLSVGALMYAVGLSASRMTGAGEPAGSAAHGPLLISDLGGAAQRFPLLALALSLAVLGLAGLPPLAGFMSKWQIFVAGFGAHNWVIGGLVVFAALNSVLSLAYYAPLVNEVYKNKMSSSVQNAAALPWTINLPLVFLAVGVVVLGLWPSLAQWLTSAAGSAVLHSFGW
jgi:proton-translocating NADH-quinone oxidoreductase chain N